jgi:t-SNARE complex subunit (syntaxin)
MKFFRKFREQFEASMADNHKAIESSQALLDELDRTEHHVDKQHQDALHRLNKSENQARRLKDADRRNHYSEGLTKSFRGKLT